MSKFKIVDKGYEDKERRFWFQIEIKEKYINFVISQETVDDVFFDNSGQNPHEAIKVVIERLESEKRDDGDVFLNYLVREALDDEEVKKQFEKKKVASFTVLHSYFKKHRNKELDVDSYYDFRT